MKHLKITASLNPTKSTSDMFSCKDEPFEQFVTDLKLLYKEYGYDHTMEDEMIRDHIVFGVKSTKVRKKLTNVDNDLTLEKCMDISRTYELSQKQLKSMNSDEDPNVLDIRSKFLTKQRLVRKQEKTKSSSKNLHMRYKQ